MDVSHTPLVGALHRAPVGPAHLMSWHALPSYSASQSQMPVAESQSPRSPPQATPRYCGHDRSSQDGPLNPAGQEQVPVVWSQRAASSHWTPDAATGIYYVFYHSLHLTFK